MYGEISSTPEDTRNLTMYTTDEKTLCYVNCVREDLLQKEEGQKRNNKHHVSLKRGDRNIYVNGLMCL